MQCIIHSSVHSWWLVLYVSTGDLRLNQSVGKIEGKQLPLKIKHGFVLNMLLRIRLSSFLAGVAVAGTFSLYQIRQDIQKSHELLSAQVRSSTLVSYCQDLREW